MPYPLNTPLGRFGIATSEEGPQRCTATSELTLEVAPGAADVITAHPDDRAVGSSRPTGSPRGLPSGSLPGSELAELMAVQVGETGGAATSLMQLDDPVLNSSVGAVHGGVSSMGLELVGSAAVSRHSADAGFRTARRSPQRRGGDAAGRGRWQGSHGGPADCLPLRGE